MTNPAMCWNCTNPADMPDVVKNREHRKPWIKADHS